MDLFAIPLFLKVREPPRAAKPARPRKRASCGSPSRLGETLPRAAQAQGRGLLLLAFLVYNDAIETIIRMATTFGTEMGIATRL